MGGLDRHRQSCHLVDVVIIVSWVNNGSSWHAGDAMATQVMWLEGLVNSDLKTELYINMDSQ